MSIGREISDRKQREEQLEEFASIFRNAIEHGGRDVTIAIGELDQEFYLEDTDSGTVPKHRDEIFDGGHSSKDDGTTKFGSSIVEQMVEAHGWDTRVTEGSDGWARFEITGRA